MFGLWALSQGAAQPIEVFCKAQIGRAHRSYEKSLQNHQMQ